MKIDINELYKVKGIGKKTIERIEEEFREKPNKEKIIKDFKSVKIGSSELYHGDCLEVMDYLIDKNIKVDAIITDPPYGTTACKWDSVIPFAEMWYRLKHLRNDNTPIVLFGSEPFSSSLRFSNINEFKYDWIWHKSKSGSAFTAKYRPLQKHEIISIFGKGVIRYKPQLEEGKPYYRKRSKNRGDKPNNHNLGVISESETINNGFRYPSTVKYFQQKWRRQDQMHPTQKPVKLLEYLVKTYTNEGDTVLDFTMGSGTTGVAAKNLNRKFIGIELDKEYFNISIKRLRGDL